MAERKTEELKMSSEDEFSSEKAPYCDIESNITSKGGKEWRTVLRLAFQSLGVVYGDIGTSPLYVYATTFQEGIRHEDDILGVLSLIFYTITLITLFKYGFIVLQANDHGHGGTCALYSLLCRHARVGMIPNKEIECREESSFQPEVPGKQFRRASMVKAALENSIFAKFFLLVATMFGTAMVVGDGILTPCISVLSALGGIKMATEAITQDEVVWISVLVLIFLFITQRFGTDKVGYTFAPIITVWFILNAGIGTFNFFKFDPSVIKAINPVHIINYFIRNGKSAWISLGGVVLCITGVEALFDALGHFSVKSIQMSMSAVVFPSLILAYTGQASYLRKNMDQVSETFYKSIPGPIYWPMFVVALLAAIISSQAMISGTFSIIQATFSLGCFPRVKVIHTSAKHEGQIYIPEVNYALMLACISFTATFKSTVNMGNAYGIALLFVMNLTSLFLVLVMLMIWKTHIVLIILYVLVIQSIELVYLSSVLYKFNQGGYLPLSFAVFLIAVMLLWNYVHLKKYMHELEHKVPSESLQEMATFQRIPGLALFYSELAEGIPPIFEHYITNVPALHSVVVLVSVKSLPISKVPLRDRFLFRRVKPHKLFMFRCVARYGYRDMKNDDQEPFVTMLVQRLKEFMSEDRWETDGDVDEEVEMVEREWRNGVVHLVGQSELMAKKGSGFWKKVVINYAYNYLKRIVRQQDEVFTIPRSNLLKVGMTIEL
ncbi:hypothetical protein J5N97_015232 [Dioscorea zingiberensis]|uniref:Potassium transporter n=1 Tax=Dioscorea zingiberensis TaxID=325984 RepID=A0A9D5HKH8_9LILI|nr:hypothetical protein J5N97_015232 [Dioscorea zingiberensis]